MTAAELLELAAEFEVRDQRVPTPREWAETMEFLDQLAHERAEAEDRFRDLFAPPAGGCVHAEGICHCQIASLGERIRAAQDRARIGPLR